jgi:hypothetical protein
MRAFFGKLSPDEWLAAKSIKDPVRKPAQRATAFSPGRVREPLGTQRRYAATPRARAAGDSIRDTLRWQDVFNRRRAIARCAGSGARSLLLPRPRGLALGYTLAPAARARARDRCCYPRLADSPWATRWRPLRGLGRAIVVATQGSRTRLGLHTGARCAGSGARSLLLPRARGLALGYTLAPAARARVRDRCCYPGLADSPWPTHWRPLRGLGRAIVVATQGLRTRLGLHAGARCAGLGGAIVAATQGSRTRPGLHAGARCAGLVKLPLLHTWVASPGLADLPGYMRSLSVSECWPRSVKAFKEKGRASTALP